MHVSAPAYMLLHSTHRSPCFSKRSKSGKLQQNLVHDRCGDGNGCTGGRVQRHRKELIQTFCKADTDF
eukprot:73670-Pleurochrysis_carterae.AAC.1